MGFDITAEDKTGKTIDYFPSGEWNERTRGWKTVIYRIIDDGQDCSMPCYSAAELKVFMDKASEEDRNSGVGRFIQMCIDGGFRLQYGSI